MPRSDFLKKINYVLDDAKINPSAGKDNYKKVLGYRRKQLKGKLPNLNAYQGKKI